MVKLSMNGISTLEIIVIVLFILFLIFQVSLPEPMIQLLHSNLGMVVLLCIVAYLFLYTNPVLGILSIFVVYELIRRSRGFSNLYAHSSGQFTPNPMVIKTYPTHAGHGYNDDDDENPDITASLNPKSVHFADNDDDDTINPTKMNISTKNAIQNIRILEYTPDEQSRTSDMERMNPTPNDELEIDVVNTMAPMGQLPSSTEYIETGFKPIMDNTHNAMSIY
jgi:hypothetical protein